MEFIPSGDAVTQLRAAKVMVAQTAVV